MMKRRESWTPCSPASYSGENSHRVRPRSGFTLVEILVSILIFGLLMAVLTYTLLGSLRLNQEGQRQIGTAAQAQDVLEQIRAAWKGPGTVNYDRACAPVSLPEGLTAVYVDLDSRANPLAAGGAGSAVVVNPAEGPPVDCAAQPLRPGPGGSLPPIRRLTVQSEGSPGNPQSAQSTTLTLDILRTP